MVTHRPRSPPGSAPAIDALHPNAYGLPRTATMPPRTALRAPTPLWPATRAAPPADSRARGRAGPARPLAAHPTVAARPSRPAAETPAHGALGGPWLRPLPAAAPDCTAARFRGTDSAP